MCRIPVSAQTAFLAQQLAGRVALFAFLQFAGVVLFAADARSLMLIPHDIVVFQTGNEALFRIDPVSGVETQIPYAGRDALGIEVGRNGDVILATSTGSIGKILRVDSETGDSDPLQETSAPRRCRQFVIRWALLAGAP